MDNEPMRPMIFSCEKAKSYLLGMGQVVTVRKKEYSPQKVWIRASRTGKKIAEGERKLIRTLVNQKDLQKCCKDYSYKSGFDSWRGWYKECLLLYDKGDYPLYLYEVRLKKISNKEIGRENFTREELIKIAKKEFPNKKVRAWSKEKLKRELRKKYMHS